MIRLAAGVLLGAALALGATRLASSSPAEPSLADKVNAACRPGYTVADWAANDVMDYIPEGSIVVTCENKRTADIYQVAVQR